MSSLARPNIIESFKYSDVGLHTDSELVDNGSSLIFTKLTFFCDVCITFSIQHPTAFIIVIAIFHTPKYDWGQPYKRRVYGHGLSAHFTTVYTTV